MRCDAAWLASPEGRHVIIKLAVRTHQMLQERLGPEFYSVPVLDMLLDLYLHKHPKARSLTSLCGAACVPVRSALRAINRMADRGLVARAPDLDDGRRTNVELTERAIALLDGYFDTLLSEVVRTLL